METIFAINGKLQSVDCDNHAIEKAFTKSKVLRCTSCGMPEPNKVRFTTGRTGIDETEMQEIVKISKRLGLWVNVTYSTFANCLVITAEKK